MGIPFFWLEGMKIEGRRKNRRLEADVEWGRGIKRCASGRAGWGQGAAHRQLS